MFVRNQPIEIDLWLEFSLDRSSEAIQTLQSLQFLATKLHAVANGFVAGADRFDRDRFCAIERAAQWALACRNVDGGFGHYPGSPSDADAIYFQVGTLVMAGFLTPAAPLPPDAHLLGWGHLFPTH